MLKRKEAELNGDPVPNQKDWAKSYGIPQGTFDRYLRANDVKRLLAKKNVPVDKIPHQKSFESLQRLSRFDEDATIKVAKMAVDYRIGAKEVQDIVKDYIDAPSVSAKVQMLAKADNRLKRLSSNGKRKSGYTKRTPESRLKETVFRVEQQVSKIDQDKFEKLLGDKDLKNAVTACKLFFNSIS